MSKEGPLDTLIHTIYETALDAGRWASALQQLAEYLAAAACHFIVWNKRANAVSFSVLTGAPPEADGSYGAYYASIDPLLQLAMAHSPGDWLRCHEHFDENFVRRNEFYRDYLAPYGLRHRLGGKLVESNDCSALVTLLRGPGQAPFSDSDFACVRRIEGHLQRAARLHLAAGDLRARAQMSASALDSLSYALWIVTAEGALRYLNTKAEAILQTRDGLGTNQGRLRATNGAHAHLARLIEAAAQPNGARRSALFIERPNGQSAYHVFVLPLLAKSTFAAEWQVPLALVLAKDITQRVAGPPLEEKRRFFTLTHRALKDNAVLLLVDVMRAEHEDRASYLRSYLGHLADHWLALTEEEFLSVSAHIEGNDFPELSSLHRAMAQELGFPQAQQLSQHTWHQSWCFHR